MGNFRRGHFQNIPCNCLSLAPFLCFDPWICTWSIIKHTTGTPNFSRTSIKRNAFLYPSDLAIPKITQAACLGIIALRCPTKHINSGRQILTLTTDHSLVHPLHCDRHVNSRKVSPQMASYINAKVYGLIWVSLTIVPFARRLDLIYILTGFR